MRYVEQAMPSPTSCENLMTTNVSTAPGVGKRSFLTKTPVRSVIPTSQMPNGDFAQHMGMRHKEPFKPLAFIPFITEGSRKVWEAYHRWLHKHTSFAHSHEEG
jgi:hypothetical protein